MMSWCQRKHTKQLFRSHVLLITKLRRLNKCAVVAALTIILFNDALGADPARLRLPATGPYFPCDDRIIEDRWQIERFVVTLRPYSGNPVLRKDKEWEGIGPLAGGSVLQDPQDGIFKLWYQVFDEYAYNHKIRFSYSVCYAESRDGLEWEKPSLGLFSYQGKKENNMIKLGRNKTSGLDVEINPEPAAGKQRLVAIHNDSGGVFVSYSQDGKSFDCSFVNPAVRYHSDTHNNFLYDEVGQRWLMYVRPKAYAGAGLKDVGRRRVAVMESRDLQAWTVERTVLVPGEDDPDYFYGMTVFRRGDLFFGALQLYETVGFHIDCELVWSEDGYRWHRLPANCNRLLLKRGPEGSWDGGMVFVLDKPLVVGNEMRFYFGGSDTPHDRFGKNALGLATTKLDRLIGARAKSDTLGRLLTRPLPVSGDLWLNAQATGSIRVSVHTADDQPMSGWSAEDCTPFAGDELNAPVRWGGKRLRDLSGQTVRLRFHLRDAVLYSFDLHD